MMKSHFVIAALFIFRLDHLATWSHQQESLRRVSEECRRTAQEVYEKTEEGFSSGGESAFTLYIWSNRWMEADGLLAKGKSDLVRASTAHLDRMKAPERLILSTVVARRRLLGSYLAWQFF